MAVKGKPKFAEDIKFDVPWPDNLKGGKVNLLWRKEEGSVIKGRYEPGRITEVGFRADAMEGVVEEWYDVAAGQDPAQVVIEFVHPRVAELSVKMTKPPLPAPEAGKDFIAPSVAPVEEKAVRA